MTTAPHDDGNRLDWAVRLHVYHRLIEVGRAPTVNESAEKLGSTVAEIGESYRRLDAGHVLVLEPGTTEIRMAMPFSAVATEFRVTMGERSWWAN